MKITYLSPDDVIEIHKSLTGIADPSVKREVLESAVAIPQSTMFGEDLYPDFYTKAAVLLRSLTLNHPFIDGNKRVAWGAMRIFLSVNGIDIRATVKEVEAFMLGVVTGEIKLDDIVMFLVRHGWKMGDEQAASASADDSIAADDFSSG